MRGLLCTVFAAGLLHGAVDDYFPLQVGNQWVYRSKGFPSAGPLTVTVTRMVEGAGTQYAVVEGWPGGPVLLRLDESGVLYRYLPSEQKEVVYADFSKADGEAFETSVAPCNKTARIRSRAHQYTGPIGEFANALLMEYPPAGCADAGLTSDVFLPWVGLVERTETTIGGPRAWQLVYAKLGSIVEVSEPYLSFGMALDKAVYSPAAVLMARIKFRNTATPVRYVFPSGQTYDLEIRDERGNLAYRWSNGKAFTLAIRQLELFGEHNWAVTVPLADLKLAPGRYTAEGWLATQNPRQFRATVSFDVAAQ